MRQFLFDRYEMAWGRVRTEYEFGGFNTVFWFEMRWSIRHRKILMTYHLGPDPEAIDQRVMEQLKLKYPNWNK